MADISKIKVPDSTGTPVEYTIKDAYARQRLAELTANIMRYVGQTTTAITDGSTTQTITIAGKSHTAASGDVVIYDPNGSTAGNEQEFIWDGTAWREFGSKAALKALAFKNSASGTITVKEPTGATTNTLKYDKTTSVTVAGVPTQISINTEEGSATKHLTVSGHSTAGFTYEKAVKGADTVTLLKATASGGSISPSSPVTVAKTVKVTSEGTAITGIQTTDRYLKPTSIYGVNGSNTASKLKTAGSVTPGTDVSYTAGATPTFSATRNASDECLVFSFNAGTKSTVSGGKATVVTLPTFDEVSVPKVATTATPVFEGALATTTSTGAVKVVTAVTPKGTIDCITGVGIDETATAYTNYSLTAPTISLSTPAGTTPGTGEVAITTQNWSTQLAQGTIDFTGTTDIPYELAIHVDEVNATIGYTETQATGGVTVTTTDKDYTVTVS